MALESADAEAWISALTHPEPVRWVEAQYHLVHAGADGLAALEASPERWSCVEDRVARLVRSALHSTVELSALDDKPRLRALVADGIEASRAAARPLAEDPGVLWTGHRDPLRRLDLGDYRVPALLELTRAPEPAVRARAAQMLGSSTPVAVRRLREMASDRDVLRFRGEDYYGKTTVGEEVSRIARSQDLETDPDALYLAYFSILSGVPLDAIYKLAPDALSAPDWPTFWARVRPLWREYWSAVRGARSHRERYALADRWLQRREGFELERMAGTPGTRRFEILTPEGANATLSDGGTELVSGTIPLRFDVPDAARGVEVAVTGAAGTWRVSFVVPQRGQRFVLRVSAECFERPGACAHMNQR